MQEAKLISLAEAAKITPGRPNTSTLWRWARKPCGLKTAKPCG